MATTKKVSKKTAKLKTEPTPEKKQEAPASDPNMVDLGLLKLGTSKIFVNRIPKKTSAIVVNYKNSENFYRISCVIPPHSYLIHISERSEWDEDDDEEVDTSKFKIDSPTLLFTAEYATLPKPTVGFQFHTMFSIFALNTAQEDNIVTKPYMLANTYPDGSICMGNFNPITILKAFNTYWGSAFNDELFDHIRGEVPDYKPVDMYTHLLNFHSHMLPKMQWKTLTSMICGKDHWAAARGADGILVTDNQKLLAHIPAEFRREDFNGTPITITLANQKEDAWHFESGNFKFQLPLRNVTTKNSRRTAADKQLTTTQEESLYDRGL